MSTKNSLVIELPDTNPQPVPQPREYHTPVKIADPVARYGAMPKDNPMLLLYRLERWAADQVRREGGDKVDERWISYGYTLPEMQAVSIALASALYEALELSKGKLRTV